MGEREGERDYCERRSERYGCSEGYVWEERDESVCVGRREIIVSDV